MIRTNVSGMHGMCSLPVHHVGHAGEFREPSSLAGYRSGILFSMGQEGLSGRSAQLHGAPSLHGAGYTCQV